MFLYYVLITNLPLVGPSSFQGMLHYSRGDALATWYWWGGINRVIIGPSVLYLLFVSLVYFIQRWTGTFVNCSREGIHSLAGFVVFLLVFRLNQCMARYNEGHDTSANLFSALERILITAFSTTRGAMPDQVRLMHLHPEHKAFKVDTDMALRFSEYATVSKVNTARLTLALAVSYLVHSHLQDVVSDQVGFLSDFQMRQIMFLYFRLQCLLYDEEMELVDQAIHVYADDEGFQQAISGFLGTRHFRAEVSRHILSKELKSPILGHIPPHTGDQYGGKTVAALPKVVSHMLFRSLMEPVEQPWGYPQRMMNVFAMQLQEVLTCVSRLDTIIKVPLPLIYLQHCRCLLIIFALCYPMSINPTDGVMDNVIMPMFIFWSMLGFEFIAEQLENPLGDDDADINLWEHVHSLEVQCKTSFNSTEANDYACRSAMLHVAEDFNMPVASELANTRLEEPPPRQPFETYFTWLPQPSLLTQHLVNNHGQARLLHSIRWRMGFDAVNRAVQGLRRRAHQGNSYMAVGAQGAYSSDTSNIPYIEKVMDSIYSDPTSYMHYLVFRGAYSRLISSSTHGDLSCAEAIDDADVEMTLCRTRTGEGIAMAESDARVRPATRRSSESRRRQSLLQACKLQNVTAGQLYGEFGSVLEKAEVSTPTSRAGTKQAKPSGPGSRSRTNASKPSTPSAFSGPYDSLATLQSPVVIPAPKMPDSVPVFAVSCDPTSCDSDGFAGADKALEANEMELPLLTEPREAVEPADAHIQVGGINALDGAASGGASASGACSEYEAGSGSEGRSALNRPL